VRVFNGVDSPRARFERLVVAGPRTLFRSLAHYLPGPAAAAVKDVPLGTTGQTDDRRRTVPPGPRLRGERDRVVDVPLCFTPGGPRVEKSNKRFFIIMFIMFIAHKDDEDETT